MKRLYGIQTSVVYDVDGVAERLGADMVGFRPRSESIAELRESPETHFLKTHRQRDADVQPDDPAICLVRDGRDALVSWARQASEDRPDQYETNLKNMILRAGAAGTVSWGSNVLSWLVPPAPHRPVLTYAELIAKPDEAVQRVMSVAAPRQLRLPAAPPPRFSELHAVDAQFFRRGVNGSFRDEMPEELHDLFWSRRDNVAAMRLLGWPR